MILMTGCWGSREPDRLSIVLVAGIDRTADDEFLWTVGIARPRAISSVGGEGESGNQERPVVIRQGKGRSLKEGQQDLLSAANREILWSHANYILIGEDTARRGIGPILDFISRQYTMRDNAQLIVTKGQAGRFIQEMEPELEDTLTRVLTNFLIRPRKQLAPFVDINRALRDLQQDGRDIMTAFLDAAENAPFEPRMAGTAVFFEDALVGVFTEDENLGLLWAVNESKEFSIDLPCPGAPAEAGWVSIDVLRSSSQHSTHWEETGPQGRLRVKVEADVSDWACSSPLSVSTMDELDSIGETVIQEYIRAAVTKLQAHSSDVIGFGADLYRKDPKLWHSIRDHWRATFSAMPITIEVKLRIRRIGLTLETL